TKNEGILFLAVLLAARLVLGLARRPFSDTGRELLSFGIGASLGLVTLAVFKLQYSPSNDTVRLMTLEATLTRLKDGHLKREIVSGFRHTLSFGAWYVNPVPLMAIHAAIAWHRRLGRKTAVWFTAAFVLAGMLCGYYLVYLFSPYDLESHLESSLDRLVLQLW